MNTAHLINKKHLITGLSVLVLLVIGFFAYSLILNSRFRVVKYSPNNTGVITTGLPGFLLEFNRELQPGVDYMKTLSDRGKHVRSITTDGKKMIILTRSPVDGNKYAFSIRDIKAKDKSVIPNISFSFTTKYMPFDTLSKKEQGLVVLLSSQQDKLHPIISFLPHSTANYILGSYFKDSEGGVDSETLTLFAKLYLSNADVKTNKEVAISRYKKEVADYIASIGFDLNDYVIEYEIVDNSY